MYNALRKNVTRPLQLQSWGWSCLRCSISAADREQAVFAIKPSGVPTRRIYGRGYCDL